MPLYKQDSNDANKQTVNVSATAVQRVSNAICPAEMTTTKRPSYVMVNVNGTYAFAYESGSYVTGSVHPSANAGPFRLDISPVAWRQTDAAGSVGDITFVYVRVR